MNSTKKTILIRSCSVQPKQGLENQEHRNLPEALGATIAKQVARMDAENFMVEYCVI